MQYLIYEYARCSQNKVVRAGELTRTAHVKIVLCVFL